MATSTSKRSLIAINTPRHVPAAKPPSEHGFAYHCGNLSPVFFLAAIATAFVGLAMIAFLTSAAVALMMTSIALTTMSVLLFGMSKLVPATTAVSSTTINPLFDSYSANSGHPQHPLHKPMMYSSATQRGGMSAKPTPVVIPVGDNNQRSEEGQRSEHSNNGYGQFQYH